MTTQTKTEHFGKEFSKFLRKTFNQRKYLLQSRQSLKSEPRMRMCIDKLSPYVHTRFSDKGAAIFLQKNHALISQIIPAHLHGMKTRLQNFMLVAKNYQND